MPLSDFQKCILQLLASSRSPNSHVIGATLINSSDASPRYSADIDISHDSAAIVANNANTDGLTLESSGYSVRWLLQQPSFQRAVISKDNSSVILEWVHDSAFRFFPAIEDPDFGYRLHPFDSATNKILALAGRAEPRDWVDILHLHENYLPLGILAWAASAKDEGLTPDMILSMAARFAKYRQEEIDQLDLVLPLDIHELKAQWIKALEEAKEIIDQLPADEIGTCYLDSAGTPVSPELSSLDTYSRHHGSLQGAWPTSREV